MLTSGVAGSYFLSLYDSKNAFLALTSLFSLPIFLSAQDVSLNSACGSLKMTAAARKRALNSAPVYVKFIFSSSCFCRSPLGLMALVTGECLSSSSVETEDLVLERPWLLLDDADVGLDLGEETPIGWVLIGLAGDGNGAMMFSVKDSSFGLVDLLPGGERFGIAESEDIFLKLATISRVILSMYKMTAMKIKGCNDNFNMVVYMPDKGLCFLSMKESHKCFGGELTLLDSRIFIKERARTTCSLTECLAQYWTTCLMRPPNLSVKMLVDMMSNSRLISFKFPAHRASTGCSFY